jgi:regulator of protease activity HflC (stomatin/prohibitin superfamily)
MDDIGDLLEEKKRGPGVNLRWLLITLAVGSIPLVVCFLLGWWWVATVFLLLTLFIACFAMPSGLRPAIFTLYVFFALWWVSGSLLDEILPARWPSANLRSIVPVIGGVIVGLVAVIPTWLLILFVSTKWILALSDSLQVSGRKAFWFVLTQTFDTGQNYWIVDNGKVVVDHSHGLLSKFGGPGALVVRPGNAVVLERGGRVSRIEGPGVYPLKRFERLQEPVEGKGIVDLRPQWVTAPIADVLTKDGIRLEITAGMGYQIEPKGVTDRRWASKVSGGEARTPVIGGPEYPVYVETVRKAVFATTGGGWKGFFPAGPGSTLRDVVGAYTLDQIFDPHPSASPNPDPNARTVRKIEEEVNKKFNTSWAGIQFKGLDIQTIRMPPEVEERVLKRWTTAVERDLRVKDAQAEGQAIIQVSKGREESLKQLESIKQQARNQVFETADRLVRTLSQIDRDDFLVGLVNIIERLAERIGEDESIAMRYIESMQSIVESEGSKSFVITPPTRSAGMLPMSPSSPSGRLRLANGQENREQNP